MRSFIKTWSSFISRNGRECVAPSLAVLSAHQDGGRICRPQREARRGTLTHSHHKKLWSDPAAWAAGARLPPLIAYIHMCLLQREETGIGIEGNSEGCTACARNTLPRLRTLGPQANTTPNCKTRREFALRKRCILHMTAYNRVRTIDKRLQGTRSTQGVAGIIAGTI